MRVFIGFTETSILTHSRCSNGDRVVKYLHTSFTRLPVNRAIGAAHGYRGMGKMIELREEYSGIAAHRRSGLSVKQFHEPQPITEQFLLGLAQSAAEASVVAV
jgi:hypothetical protein